MPWRLVIVCLMGGCWAAVSLSVFALAASAFGVGR
jgi:hypothetical protein